MVTRGGTPGAFKKRKKKRLEDIKRAKRPGERAFRKPGRVSKKDRLELATARARRAGIPDPKLKDGEVVSKTREEARAEEIKNIAQKGIDIEAAKKGLKPTTKEFFLEEELGRRIEPGDGAIEGIEDIQSPAALQVTTGLSPGALEIGQIENQLITPGTGTVLDKINRWRLEIKLDNLKEKQRKVEAGEIVFAGTIALGTNVGAALRTGSKVIDGAGRLLGTGKGPQTGGLLGFSSIANNAKSTALTGTWLKRLGFTTKAAVALGSIIGFVAWGKHVKSEAIEFLPFQISKAREAGDEATAKELEELHAEIADPTGWANIIEEIPGLGVIKAAIDKTRVGIAIIEAQKKRA